MKNFICAAFLLAATSNQLSAQLPSGFVAKYLLNGNANDVSGNNYNGTLTGATSTTNRFGTSNSAIQLSSGTSSGTLPVVIKDNFSVGFWIKTSMNASSSSQWYGGNSLVDAEVCGVVNDWGTALINGGKIAFGTGNPDRTIISPLSYNDNSWHFITATRSETGTGTMILYVDGNQVASLTNVNVATLNSPTIIGLGRNNCTGADYTGSLDDLILYARTLSSTEVSDLYSEESIVVLPLSWVSFNGEADQTKISLQWQISNSTNNDHFEVERSTNAQDFSLIATIAANENATTANVSYSFQDADPDNGINYYRIKQINIDGTYSYSKILALTFQNSQAGIKLLANPVTGNRLMLSNASGQLIREINIVDLTGRVVAHQYLNTKNSSVQVDLSNLSRGYYLIQVNSAAKKIAIPFVKG